jgi:hypothetical protein
MVVTTNTKEAELITATTSSVTRYPQIHVFFVLIESRDFGLTSLAIFGEPADLHSFKPEVPKPSVVIIIASARQIGRECRLRR